MLQCCPGYVSKAIRLCEVGRYEPRFSKTGWFCSWLKILPVKIFGYGFKSGSIIVITCLGLATFGQLRKSYSTIVVNTGGFGHGSAQLAIHITGNKITCTLKATRKQSTSGNCSLTQNKTFSVEIRESPCHSGGTGDVFDFSPDDFKFKVCIAGGSIELTF